MCPHIIMLFIEIYQEYKKFFIFAKKFNLILF